MRDAECGPYTRCIRRTLILAACAVVAIMGDESHFEPSEIIPEGLKVCERTVTPELLLARARHLMVSRHAMHSVCRRHGGLRHADVTAPTA